jgi:hypothetical protein
MHVGQLTEVSLYYVQLITFLGYCKLAAIKVDYIKNISYVVPKFITIKVQYQKIILSEVINKKCFLPNIKLNKDMPIPKNVHN